MELRLQSIFGKKKHKLLVWSAIISALSLASCSSNKKHCTRISGETQGTTYSIILADSDSNDVHKKEIDSVLHNFDLALSIYVPNSVISQLNNADTNNIVAHDKYVYFKDCYQLSQRIYEETNGTFNPAISPLVKAWGFKKKEFTELTEDSVQQLLQFTDFKQGKLHEIDFTLHLVEFQKKNRHFELDFNAIAQGQAVDVIAELIASKGHSNFYVEIGGECYTKGKNCENKSWRVGIDTPTENSDANTREISKIISINDKALATSGSYRNFYEVNGRKYAHTIDSKTGFPVTHNLLSVTVVANTTAEADAYATAIMVMGKKKALEWIKETKPSIECLFMESSRNGMGSNNEEYEISYTDGMKTYLVDEN